MSYEEEMNRKKQIEEILCGNYKERSSNPMELYYEMRKESRRCCDEKYYYSDEDKTIDYFFKHMDAYYDRYYKQMKNIPSHLTASDYIRLCICHCIYGMHLREVKTDKVYASINNYSAPLIKTMRCRVGIGMERERLQSYIMMKFGNEYDDDKVLSYFIDNTTTLSRHIKEEREIAMNEDKRTPFTIGEDVKKPLSFLFKLSNYKNIDDIKKAFGNKIVQEAPHVKSTETNYAIYPGWTIREMVKKFDGCLLIIIDGEYKFLMPSWAGYTMFETWNDYPSVKVLFFDGYWNVQ
jgi:hypothetical protein